MRERYRLALMVAVAISCASASEAASIVYQASDFAVDGGFPATFVSSVALPDATTGGIASIGEVDESNSPPLSVVGSRLSYSGNFSFNISMGESGGSSFVPILRVIGTYQGAISIDGTPVPLWNAGIQGDATQVSAYPAQSIPEPLLDLVSHPDRLHLYIQGDVVGPMDDYSPMLLIVDPLPLPGASVVPEPSSLCTIVAAVGGLFIARRRRASTISAGRRAAS